MDSEKTQMGAPADATSLLPCPFCGGEPAESQYQAETLWSREIVTWHRVYCRTCDFGMNACEDYEALVSSWNRRATPCCQSRGCGEKATTTENAGNDRLAATDRAVAAERLLLGQYRATTQGADAELVAKDRYDVAVGYIEAVKQRDAWRAACRYLYEAIGEGSSQGRPMDLISKGDYLRIIAMIGKAESLEAE